MVAEWSKSACQTFRGGFYNSSASDSKSTPSADAYPADSSPFNEMTYVTDALKLNDDTSLRDFPMGVVINELESTQGYFPQMTLGLGTKSTLLDALKSSGKIASRTASFFAGRLGGVSSDYTEGAMAFGGYDKAKVKGKKHTAPLRPGTSCSSDMVVTITDLELNLRNGTNASLFDGSKSQSMTVCIEPSLPGFMSLPLEPYFSKWLKLSEPPTDIFALDRSFGLNFFTMRYRPDGTP
jgi:hypothetical protein